MAERFLISRLSSLGDVVCSLPAAGALKQGFPDCQITWAVDRRFAGIVRSCRHVDEVLEVKPKLNPSSWPTIEGEFDAAIDLQGLLKSGLVLKGSKAKVKVGYHWQREGAWLFSERVIPDPSSLHVVDQYVDVARAVGGQGDRADFGLLPTPDAISSLEPKLSSPGRFVVMNGGAGWVTKRWPPQHFASLIDHLAEEGVQTILIGGPTEDDRQVGKDISSGCKQPPVNLIGETSISELVALLSLAKAHVGGDTGSSHLAAGLGIPAIGLYSITRPIRSCPYGQIDRCHYNAKGLSYIEPDAVFQTVREAIAA